MSGNLTKTPDHRTAMAWAVGLQNLSWQTTIKTSGKAPAVTLPSCALPLRTEGQQRRTCTTPSTPTLDVMPTHRSLDGSKLHHDLLGEGSQPTVVAVPGGACRDPSYMGDLALTGAERPLAILHLRGTGRPPSITAPPLGGAWSQADDVIGLVDDLGQRSSTVIAHSAGCRLALAVAARFPARLDRLILLTPPASLVDTPSDLDHLVQRRRQTESAIQSAIIARERGPDLENSATFTDWQRRLAPLTYANWGPAERAHAQVGNYHPGRRQAVPVRTGATRSPFPGRGQGHCHIDSDRQRRRHLRDRTYGAPCPRPARRPPHDSWQRSLPLGSNKPRPSSTHC